MSEHSTINISIEPIELCKLLKIANMVSGGGEAKIVISEGYVLVNNEVEFQKRKKIRHGDMVEFNGELIEVAFQPLGVSKKNTAQVQTKKATTKNKANNKAPITSSQQIVAPTPQRPKRRSISF
jgi:ribosome-associated protein